MKAPNDEQAIKAMEAIRDLADNKMHQRMSQEVGTSLIALFSEMVKHNNPDLDTKAVAEQVHLMVVAYLMHGEIEKLQAVGR